MESQEKNEPRGRGSRALRTTRADAGINKTPSSRIVLVLRGLVYAARMRIAPHWSTPRSARGLAYAAIALIFITAGCGRRTTARVPPPPVKPATIGSTETGIASWYGVPYHGRPSASGEIFDMEKLTAAHRDLPFQTWVEVVR